MADLTVTCLNCGEQTRSDLPRCEKCWENPRAAPPTVTAPVVASDDVHAAPDTAFAIVFPDWSELVLSEGDFRIIGRECDIESVNAALIGFEDVSREHLSFAVDGGILLVTDLSRFGTWVGEEQLVAGVPVPAIPGHVVRLGKYCHLKVTKKVAETNV